MRRKLALVTITAALLMGCGSDGEQPQDPQPEAPVVKPEPKPEPKPTPVAQQPKSTEPERPTLGPRIGIEVKVPAEAPLEELCRTIGDAVNQKIVVENRVRAKVVSTKDLEGLPWRTGLEHIAQRAKCRVQLMQSGMIILTPHR